MRDVTGITLLSATDRSAVALPGGALEPWVTKFEVREVLSEVGRQETKGSLEMAMGCPPVVAEPALFTHRRIVRVDVRAVDGATSFEEFRIVRFQRQVSGDGDAKLDLEPIWMDLSSTVSSRVIAGADGRTDLEWYLVGVSPQKALDEIMARGAPDGWGAGTVDATLAGARVFIHCIGQTTLQLVRSLCMEVRARTGLQCEWDYAWDAASSEYKVSLTPSLGGTITHPIEGYMADGAASRWNRRKSSRTLDATKFFTRVVPIGGPDGEHGTLAAAEWTVAGTGTDTTGTFVRLNDAPIYMDNSPSATNLALAVGDASLPVTGTASPDKVYTSASVAGVAAGDKAVFKLGGGDLTFLNSGTAEAAAGVKARPYRRSDIPAYNNLLETAGVSTDLSWSGTILPPGVERSSGDVGVSRETDDEFVSAGTTAMRVTADAGGWVQATGVDLTGTGPASGYTSAWVNMRVVSGSFRLVLVGSDGATYPPDLDAVGVAEEQFRGLSLGGLQPPEADGYALRLIALEDGTEFVVDSWTVTRSSTPYDYSEDMGPAALWKAAGGLLAGEGGVLPERIEGEWIDLSQLDATVDEPKIGAAVTFVDGGIDISSRLSQITRKYADGTEIVKGLLGSRPQDVTGFLARQGRRLPGSRVPVRPTPVHEVLVSVADGVEHPSIRMAYASGVRQIRLEVPLPPADLTDYVATEGGRYGEPPVPDSSDPLPATVGVVTFGDLEDAGGEVEYVVGVTELDDGSTEAAVTADRGEYRVFGYATPGDAATARLAAALVLRAAAEPTGVAWDSLHESRVLGAKVLVIANVRATGGATLVWRQDDGDWAEPAAQTGSSLATAPTPTITDAGDGGWGFAMILPPFAAVTHPSIHLSFAARVGAEDAYRYLDTKTVPFNIQATQPPQQNIVVAALPATSTEPEGTMYHVLEA